ncbi:hypothetical protein BHM03_00006333 [Ensete ventricosum]|nr:hypothetical protein BHM03_00006333 [Ensete ventricosum]
MLLGRGLNGEESGATETFGGAMAESASPIKSKAIAKGKDVTFAITPMMRKTIVIREKRKKWVLNVEVVCCPVLNEEVLMQSINNDNHQKDHWHREERDRWLRQDKSGEKRKKSMLNVEVVCYLVIYRRGRSIEVDR